MVSATANDIVVLGATPLTLLDYIANETLNPEVIEHIIRGMAKACLDNNISLIGGETAEMPGTYRTGEYDLVGVVTGVVEKNKVITGQNIRPGDIVIGLSSSGLHTNGYSLARKLLFEIAGFNVDSVLPDLDRSIGEVLLEPHLNYTQPVLHCLKHPVHIKGMAHITGGGFYDNIPRILPAGCGVEIQLETWPILPVFQVLQHIGKLSRYDMFQTFNMGIGLIIIVDEQHEESVKHLLDPFPEFRTYTIGRVVSSANKKVRVI